MKSPYQTNPAKSAYAIFADAEGKSFQICNGRPIPANPQQLSWLDKSYQICNGHLEMESKSCQIWSCLGSTNPTKYATAALADKIICWHHQKIIVLLSLATQLMDIAIVVSVAMLSVGIGFLVLIHVCIGRAFRGLGAAGRADRSHNLGNGLSVDDLAKLPCYDFKAGEKGSGPIDCAVCLESFKMGDRCKLLPVCKHSFHAQCVDSWLLRSPVCPLCRTSADHRKGCEAASDGGVVMMGISLSADPMPLHASTSE